MRRAHVQLERHDPLPLLLLLCTRCVTCSSSSGSGFCVCQAREWHSLSRLWGGISRSIRGVEEAIYRLRRFTQSSRSSLSSITTLLSLVPVSWSSSFWPRLILLLERRHCDYILPSGKSFLIDKILSDRSSWTANVKLRESSIIIF